MLHWLWLLHGTLRMLLRDRHALPVENLPLRRQPAVARRARPRPRRRCRDRLFRAVICRVCADWRRPLVLARPETVLRWHRRGRRLFWWWRSRRPRGRQRPPAEVRDSITRMPRDNPLRGTERIRGELRELGLAVGAGSVRRHRWRRPARPPSQTRRTFLRDHAHQIWAADLFTVPTVTLRTLFVLLFVTHDRRALVRVRVTAHPTAARVRRQRIEATAWGRRPRYVLRDRDAVYDRAFGAEATALGIATLLTPFRAPRANAIPERVIRTLHAAPGVPRPRPRAQ